VLVSVAELHSLSVNDVGLVSKRGVVLDCGIVRGTSNLIGSERGLANETGGLKPSVLLICGTSVGESSGVSFGNGREEFLISGVCTLSELHEVQN